ncbi:hypothetical protein LCGC14_2375280 [marine sediment metagenome]|uniref:Uncharacterized protein n=1 Tax=marine sediment metagenome TaxID=412755 RepID=A0A0F9C2M8_9ZZZZ
MKRRLLIACAGLWMVCGAECEEESAGSADEAMRTQTEQAMQEANAQIGMPAIKNFQERKLAKMIFELRDQEDLVCYAYIASLEGKLIFVGKCIGFGLPYSVQFTNPEKVVHRKTTQGGSFGTLPQADPNGLFMPSGLSATWLMMIDKETGDPRPVYFEPQIVVSPFPLHAP